MGGKWFSKQHNIEYLTFEEEQIIIGSLLGDGNMDVSTSGETARFCESHTAKQVEYLKWKVCKLQRLGARYSEFPRINYLATRLRTPYLQILSQYRSLFYADGVKIIRDELLGYINRLALAIWFMDDGTLRKRGKDLPSLIRLMTEGFTYTENLKLLVFLKKRFALGGHIEKKYRGEDRKQTYYLELSTNTTRRFATLVEPFIHSTMRYKLNDLQGMF